MMGKIVFICGTDTGSGKTVLTGLLTRFSRDNGIDAVALKPFCSGSREDVDFLQLCQDSALTDDEVNPWFFKKPLAPYADLKTSKKYNFKKPLNIQAVVKHIETIRKEHNLIFVEGIGGLMVPITKYFLFIDIISKLKAPVILTAKNRLGAVNHTLLSVKILKYFSLKCRVVVLMNEEKPDLSSKSNSEIISEFSGGIDVFEIPFLRDIKPDKCQEKKVAKNFKKILAQIIKIYKF